MSVDSRMTLFAKAFAPSHITGFFQIFTNGSTGAGINTNDGAVTEVEITKGRAHSITVEINGTLDTAPVSRQVLIAFEQKLADCQVKVRHHIFFPIGYGMGMSGAGAFSLSLAMNRALNCGFDYQQCMNIARQAEIAAGTGLGDVVAQQFCGLMYGQPPFPSFSVKQIALKPMWVVCAFFEPIETSAIIRDESWRSRINRAGEKCMRDIAQTPTLEQYLRSAREFTFETRLPSSDLMKVLESVPESSMAMLGQTAYIVTENVSDAVKKLMKFTDRIQVSALSSYGATEVLDLQREML